MKKLFSLLLALTMALSLLTPALAAEETLPPALPAEAAESAPEVPEELEAVALLLVEEDADAEWEAEKAAWMEAHAAEAAAFDADGWFREHYSYCTKDEYMTNWEVADEAAFRELMFQEYLDQVEEKEARRQAVAEYAAEHPGVLDGFDPMAYLTSHYGYRDPKAAFMEDYELDTEAEFVEYLQYDYITAIQESEARGALIAAYEAEHPGATDGFDPDAFLAENYPWDDKEEFMRAQGLDTEEDYRDYLLCEWIYAQEYGSNRWWDVDCDAEKAVLGGVPGELGVMVNGVYLTFTDKKPYAQDGVTYVPSLELSEALGREPKTVTQNGYSPLRASAEEAGFAVYWDAGFETAVLLDLSAQAEALDGRFTILNAALEQWGMDPEQNHKSTCTIAIDATLFNSIDGDKTYAMTAALEQLASPEGTSVSGSYDLSALESMLRDLMGEELYASLTEDGGEEFRSLLDLLKSGDFQVRCDYESGIIYLTASSFPTLFSIMGKTYPKDVWLSWESTATVPSTSGTVGSILTAAALASAEAGGYVSPVYYYQTAVSYGEQCAGLLGDEQFEKKGADRVLSLDAETLTPLLYGMTSESYYYDELTFKELSLELVVKPDGTVTGSFAVRPESALSAILDYRAAGDWALSGGEQEVHMEFHMKNLGKVTVTIEGETKAAAAAPETVPPANAAVVPMDEVTG